MSDNSTSFIIPESGPKGFRCARCWGRNLLVTVQITPGGILVCLECQACHQAQEWLTDPIQDLEVVDGNDN